MTKICVMTFKGSIVAFNSLKYFYSLKCHFNFFQNQFDLLWNNLSMKKVHLPFCKSIVNAQEDLHHRLLSLHINRREEGSTID